ncbi:odorant receptor 131-2-like [Platichthys flesus]|uniref:odorant receptor 131-2-like n=1 Tax=Platichthys flesus TaxID=8260 RepID=UPI002DB6266B|nr:odorant receptor 131-2-like [Platichthys flesus]
MLSANLSLTNVTAGDQYQSLLERLLFSTVTSVPCCIFLFINVTMLFTLRSKAVFCESSRYILLFNLLLADTMQMTLSQLMFIIVVCRTRLLYPVCGLLVMLTKLTNEVSPLTLVVMSLERYVAVCHPMRHASIVTSTNTALAIMVVWAISSLNVLVRVLLLLDFPFEDLDTLQMKDFCSDIAMLLGPVSDDYDRAFVSFVFVLAAAVITSTYIGVMVAARSASADKASARKARNTLLLHLVQLGLSLSSTVYNPILTAVSRRVKRLVFVRLQNVFYVCIFIFPRCLSSLIYGIRDQTIRPALTFYLCCRLKVLRTNTRVSAS